MMDIYMAINDLAIKITKAEAIMLILRAKCAKLHHFYALCARGITQTFFTEIEVL